MSGDRRFPPTLQGLLNFCTSHTVTEDAPDRNEVVPMSEERRAWLADAIQNSVGSRGTDPVKLMLEDVKIVLEDPDVEKKEEALEDLQDLCEDLDLANDLQKVGGYSFLQALLASSFPGLRARAAALLGTMVQNNPPCQQGALEAGLLTVLLARVEEDEEERARLKALFALSCLVRGFAPAQKVLLASDGLSVLLRVLQAAGGERLRGKAAFLLATLSAAEPDTQPQQEQQAQAPPGEFVATREWQTLRPGQSVPPGLHVRLNMTTGHREAKLVEADSTQSNMQVALPDEVSSGQAAGSSGQAAGSSGRAAGSSGQAAGSSGQGSASSQRGDAGKIDAVDLDDNIPEVLCQMGLTEQLVGLLAADHDGHHEHLMRALLALATRAPDSAIRECRRPELQLQTTLEERMAFLEGKEEFREEFQYAAELFQKCFTGAGQDLDR